MDIDRTQSDLLLSTTRSVRKRLDLDRPVEREVILECIRLAVQAPPGGNSQTWRWMVLTTLQDRASARSTRRRQVLPAESAPAHLSRPYRTVLYSPTTWVRSWSGAGDGDPVRRAPRHRYSAAGPRTTARSSPPSGASLALAPAAWAVLHDPASWTSSLPAFWPARRRHRRLPIPVAYPRHGLQAAAGPVDASPTSTVEPPRPRRRRLSPTVIEGHRPATTGATGPVSAASSCEQPGRRDRLAAGPRSSPHDADPCCVGGLSCSNGFWALDLSGVVADRSTGADHRRRAPRACVA